ncbi:MAG TPA: hypothetical protein VK327_05945 [Candidatus Paceibacterota bacterium]|nr:hypothetical protein [Candidatus Paceibacterota bacterium]
MTDVAGLAIFAIGIVLLISGFDDFQMLAPVAEDSGGTLWLIAGGTCSVVGGLILAIRSRRA